MKKAKKRKAEDGVTVEEEENSARRKTCKCGGSFV
jgi:hypothetical protein